MAATLVIPSSVRATLAVEQGSAGVLHVEQDGAVVAIMPVVTASVEVVVPDAQLNFMTESLQGLDGATGYVHTQASAAAVWTVPHNLGRRPSVSVTSVGGVEVLGGEVQHLSSNTLTITFDVPFAGEAYLI